MSHRGDRVGGEREWLTIGEVKHVVHDELHRQIGLQNDILESVKVTLDKIADGAQAQMQSALILHGDPGSGLKGVLPDIQERLDALEVDMRDVRTDTDRRHAQTSGRLDNIELNQNRIWRSVKKLCEWVTTTDNGAPNYKRMLALGTAMGAGMHLASAHLPRWATIKMALGKVAAMLTNQ